MPRTRSFAVTPNGSGPLTRISIVLGFGCTMHWVASTCSTWVVPMPRANAPNAPCVEVWLSPQTMVMPGLGESLLRRYHVHDALQRIVHVVQRDAELLAVPRQRLELRAGDVVGNRQPALPGGDVVVGGRYRQVGAAHPAPVLPEAVERLRRRHLMHKVQVDVEERRPARLLVDDVRVPYLLEHRSWRHMLYPVNNALLQASRYAFPLASITSAEAPRPVNSRPR